MVKIKLLKAASLFIFVFCMSNLFSADQEEQLKQPEREAIEGLFIWADLYTADLNVSIDFYTKTFGWSVKKVNESDGNYHIFIKDGLPVAGIIERSAERQNSDKSLWIGSIVISDLNSLTQKAQSLGSKLLITPHDFDLFGRRAVLADPKGGIIALFDHTSIVAGKEIKTARQWLWAQLFSVNPKEASDFYASAFGYSILDESTESKETYLLSQQDIVRAGVAKLPDSVQQRDQWVNFVEVQNIHTTLTAAVKNGASIIYSKKEDAQLAIIADPNGALLGLMLKPSIDLWEQE